MFKLNEIGCDSGSNKEKGIKTEGVMIFPSMEAFKSNTLHFDNLKEHAKPGYQMCSFVKGFVQTEAEIVPQVKTSMDKKDILSTVLVRIGIKRHDYKVSPGLYCVGTPDKDSEVFVTANFKLTFDHLRRELEGINAWILVLDTKGVNVWCAAGKKTFSTKELVKRVKTSLLDKVVSHKRLIVPQLGATGVSARDVKKQSGFEVVYGPIRAKDIPEFLKNNRKTKGNMRKVTFSFIERLILTPIELKAVLKPVLIIAIVLFIISGFGPGFFSFSNAWTRGLTAIIFLFTGILSGAVITPALLPFIPFREFAAKGIISGIAVSGLSILMVSPSIGGRAFLLSLSLFTIVISSILAMNFTGATPFTSPSGVEKEMRRFLPIQAIIIVVSTGLWIYSAF